MRGDGWLTGYGMAPALDVVSALERIHATLPAAIGHVFGQGRRSCRSHLDRAPAAAWPRRGSR